MTEHLPGLIGDDRAGVVEVALEDQAQAFLDASRAANTRRAYRSDWTAFVAWCTAQGRTAMPADPTTVALYVTAMTSTSKPATIRRRMSSIAVAHQAGGHPSPVDSVLVRATWAGIRRTIGTRQVAKEALLTEQIRAMVRTLPETLAGQRDACLLLVGFASGLRRSELVGLDVADVVEKREGLVITLSRSKTDQDGQGREVGLPYGSDPTTCPVRAYRAWCAAADLVEGPVFRSVNRHGQLGATRLSDRAVAVIVQRSALAAGLDPSTVAAHSLRSGMATSAARAGASEAAIMSQTGHRSVATVRRYIQRGSLFTDNAAARLGL